MNMPRHGDGARTMAATLDVSLVLEGLTKSPPWGPGASTGTVEVLAGFPGD